MSVNGEKRIVNSYERFLEVHMARDKENIG